MALFGSKKNNRVLDLTEKYKKQLDAETQQAAVPESASQETQSSEGLGFFGNMASAGVPEPSSDSSVELQEGVEESESGSVDERKKKLAKRFTDMTSQIENLSNQIYHLQQRIEVLERKSGLRIE